MRPIIVKATHAMPVSSFTRRRISDYPNLSAWLRDMWQIKVDGSSMQVSSLFFFGNPGIDYVHLVCIHFATGAGH